MENRNTDMQAIFSELSEKNKDIVILIAKSVKVAQEATPQLLVMMFHHSHGNATTQAASYDHIRGDQNSADLWNL